MHGMGMTETDHSDIHFEHSCVNIHIMCITQSRTPNLMQRRAIPQTKELKQEKKVSKGNKVSVGWGMREMNPLVNFFSGIANDPRIGITHIALYSALYQLWAKQHCANSLWIYSYNVLRNWRCMVISGMCHPTILLREVWYIWIF